MGRMDQNSETRLFTPEVTCVSSTTFAKEVLFCIWWGSRHKRSILPGSLNGALNDVSKTPYQEMILHEICEAYPEYAGVNKDDAHNVVNTIVKTLIDSDLPPLEAISFTFEIDNCTVAFREQLVRGRQSGYWTQTSRTMSLEYMDVNRATSIETLGGKEAVKIYDDTVDTIRKAYESLKALGVPEEDIRLQPSAQVHRVYWMTNLRVLLKTLNKRVDWIAQATLWSPVISGILYSLRYYVDPNLLNMIRSKSCTPKVGLSKTEDGELVVSSHTYDIENMDRYVGKDPQPVDPLWLAYKGYKMPKDTDLKFYHYLKGLYLNIWPDEYLKVLGWNRSNIDVQGKYDVPEGL